MTAHDSIVVVDLPMESFTFPLAGLSETLTCGLTSRRSQRGWAHLVLPTGRGLFFGLVLTWLSFFR
jgi:hypothetical protein